jgi:hypothetical protein
MTEMQGPDFGASDDEPGINRFIQKAALKVNRRGFLGRAGASTFGLLAGFSVGTAQGATLEPPCAAPYEGGSCREASLCFCTSKPCGDLCRTYSCENLSPTSCYGDPNRYSCWELNGNLCCDCLCSGRGHSQNQSFYCYCNYPT